MPLDEKAQNPFTQEQWAVIASALQALTRSEGWDCYTEMLGRKENEVIQELVTADKDQHDYLRGYIMGLRKAYHYPDEVMQQMRS